MAQAPLKIRAVGYDDPFSTTPSPQLKVRPVGYDDPFATPATAPAQPPARTPGLLEDVNRGIQGLTVTADVGDYYLEKGLARLFGAGNIAAANRVTSKVGLDLLAKDKLVKDVGDLNTMPNNPVMAQAGDAFHKSPTTLGGLFAGAKVIASNPTVIPHMVAEMAPSLPIGGTGGRIASKLAVPVAERIALKVGVPIASKVLQTSAFGAGMNTAMTVANAGNNVAGQERANPSASGTINPTNVDLGLKQTAGQVPGSMLAGALLPAGSSRFVSPAARIGARVLTQSAVQAGGNIISTVGGNTAIGKATTPEELFTAGAAGLATGPMDLAASALHARKAAFEKLVGDFATRGNAAPDIEGVHQFGDTPHAADGGYAETPDGVIADKHGAPVAFADHKAAARFAAANDLGGSHELAVASSPDGEHSIVLRRRAPVATVRPVDGDPFANPSEAHDPSSLPVVEPQPVAAKPGAAGGDGLRPEPAAVRAQAAPVPAESPEPPVLHGDDLRPDPGPLADGEHYVTTPSGNRIRSRFEVVDSSALKPADGDLQNRDRSRGSTDLQVQDMVSGFDPTRLGASPETDRGAPIVGQDGTVESGNGRMLAINRIQGDPQHAEKAAAYRDYIESQGHSTEGIANPVLIRRRTNDFTPEQRRQFVIDSNKDAKLSMTSVERARSDADALDGNSLALFRGGDVGSAANVPFVKAFNAKLAGGELAAQIDEHGQPSQEGVTRIENALMARAYENPHVLSKLIEARDNNIRSIGAGMLDNAGPWAQLRAAVKEGHVKPEFDVTPQLVEAARRVSDIRARGAKIGDELSQSTMFPTKGDDAITESFMRAFYNPTLSRAASREAISDAIATYARRAAEQTTSAKLFGGDDATPAGLLDDILRERTEGGTGDMFAQAAERGTPVDDPHLDTWHDEVKARRAARQEKANDHTDGKPQGDEGGDRRQPRQAPGEEAPAEEGRGSRGAEAPAEGGSSRGGDGTGGGGVRATEGPDLFEGLNDKPDYSVGEAGPHDDAYDPDFLTESFTNRTSIFNSAAEALGIDPDKFTLMPAPRQVALLKDAIKVKFGVEMKVDQGMQERFAIDQMLDAFQNLQGMAHVLDLPNEAINLDGKLTVMLQKKGNFLGMYQPGANVITLPKRSNSFAHEWGHALDYYLLSLTNGNGRGLTGSIRQEGDRVTGALPATVREAFVDLLNAMFFDKAQAAHRIMELEAKIAATDSAKVKAASQLAIDKLKAGNSQVRDIRSAFYKGAKVFDGPGGDYWTSPTEMFARAFEAYVSYKVDAAGLTAEFIGKGDAGYLSDADKRFALTFPKGEERANIFSAFEQVFGQISDEKTLGIGKGAEKPGGTTRRVTDYDRTPAAQPKERGIINREVTAIKQALLQTRKRAADRADNAKGMAETAADLNAVIFGSMTGNLRLIYGRSKSPSLLKLIDLLTKQDGRGDRTVARTFAEDVHLQSKRSINRLANILKANKLQHLDSEQDVFLRDLLVGARSDGPDNFVKGAAAIRHLLDEEFYANQRAGIDLGYTRNGYLARVLDLPKVAHDQDGFVKQAAKVYAIVFDNEFGTEAAKLVDHAENLPAFMKLARFLAKSGHDLPSLDGVRKLLKQVKKLEADGAEQDEIDKLRPAIGELMAEVRPAYSSERADAWLAKINLGAGEEHNAASPDSKYTKKRDLPPEADKIMEKYYLSDPVESVINYLNTSARRTSYAKRFGGDGKKRAALFEGMAAEGVSREDQTTVSRILDTATGRVKSNLPRSVEQVASFVTAYTQMALLPRAMLSSLAEPFTAAMVTGNAVDGFHIVGNMLSALIRSPNGRARFELARAMGIVTDHAGDGIMEARYGQSYADATRWDRLTSKMFARTGLTGLTRAQKTAMVGVAHAYLDNLAHTIMAKSRWTSAAAKKNAIALLREFGVRDPEAFAKQMVDANRMPTVEELDTDFGYDYATAQLRLNNMVIQEPGMMDRPEFAANPVARIFYALQGFTYGYYRNIIKRNIILMNEMGKKGSTRGGKMGAGIYGSKLFIGAAIAYAIGVTVSTIREAVLNPKRFQQMQDDGTLWSNMALLGFNRTFSFGAADTAINAAVGLKYRRDLSNVMVGAGPATIAQNTGKLLQPITANSRTTNTAEYSAVQGAYGLLSPFLNFGLSRMPGGALVSTAAGVGMAYATSPAARDAVATMVAGPKNGTVVAGKKTKSGPTAWDRMLDSAFGKDVKKKSAHVERPYLH